MTGTFVVPNSFVSGTTIASAPANQNFTQANTNLNSLLDSSNKVTDANLASANNSAYRTLMFCNTAFFLDLAAATYILANVAEASPASLGTPAAQPPMTYFDDADFTVGSLTQKLRIRAQASTNATQPTITFTVGLYPITFAGIADTLTATLGTVVAGSTVALASPAASLTTQGSSGDFTIPADGQYCFGCVTSGTLTNNNFTTISAQLQTRSV